MSSTNLLHSEDLGPGSAAERGRESHHSKMREPQLRAPLKCTNSALGTRSMFSLLAAQASVALIDEFLSYLIFQ